MKSPVRNDESESFEGDLTWLLHRAAQRMRRAMEEQSAQHEVDLRDYLVLTALRLDRGQTQLALGKAIGVDETTMTVLLDRLEKKKYVVRRAAPADRRARLPEVTAAGRRLQKRIAKSVDDMEGARLAEFSEAEQRLLRAMLRHLVGQDALSGSCI